MTDEKIVEKKMEAMGGRLRKQNYLTWRLQHVHIIWKGRVSNKECINPRNGTKLPRYKEQGNDGSHVDA